MNKTGLIIFLGALGVSSMGCSSSSSDGGGGGSTGPAPDFGALQTRLTQPTGTFAAGQEAAVTDGYGAQSTSAQQSPFGGSGSSSTKSVGGLNFQTVHPLGGGSINCPQLTMNGGGKGNCACPNGGSIDFDVPAGAFSGANKPGQDPNAPIDQTVAIAAHACATADQGIDGSIFWKIKNPPPLQIFSVHVVITGKQAGSYDVDYLMKDGKITFAIKVADGNVLVSASGNWDKATKSGTLVITDKAETWTCVLMNGKGKCTSDKGGSRNVGS